MARKGKKNRFKGKTSANAHRRKTQTSRSTHMRLPKGVDLFEAVPGSVIHMDFMPYIVSGEDHPDRDDEYGIAIPGAIWYKRPYRVHKISVGEDTTTITCPTSIGKKCPICEYRAQQLEKGASWDDQEMKDLKAKDRELYIVNPKQWNKKEYKELEERPYIWDFSYHLFQKQLDEELDLDDKHDGFPDLEDGETLKVRFSAEKYKTFEFASTSRIDFEEREKQYSDDMAKKMPDLDEVLIILPYDVIHAKFFGLEDEATATDSPEPPDQDEDDIPNFEDEQDNEPPDDENMCVACQGTGTNSKGRECRVCNGEGVKPEKEEEEPEPKMSDKEKRIQERKERKQKEAAKAKGKDERCPYGFAFGTDCEEHDECGDEKCGDAWDDCMDEKDRLEG